MSTEFLLGSPVKLKKKKQLIPALHARSNETGEAQVYVELVKVLWVILASLAGYEKINK